MVFLKRPYEIYLSTKTKYLSTKEIFSIMVSALYTTLNLRLFF